MAQAEGRIVWMIRPADPLICHAQASLTREFGLGYRADLDFFGIPHVVELYPDYKFCLFSYRFGHDDPFKLTCRVVKHKWGYGATGEINTFPFYVAVLKDGETIKAEIWGEPPRRGGKMHPDVERMIEQMAKRVRA